MVWLALLACSTSSRPADDHAFARAGGGPVRFVAVGDVGKGNDTQQQVARAMGDFCALRGCDFGLLLGDNLYPDGMTEPDDPRMDAVFTDIYGGLLLDFYAVLGNHDYGRQHIARNAQHQLDWAAKNDRFQMPRAYYRFRSDAVAFWALDTDAVFWEGVQPQAGWLDETLPSVDARWKVVFGHHPWRSNGKHGNAGAYEGWSNVPYSSGNALSALFTDHVAGRAHLYVSGHDHNLQSLRHDGTELVVSGSGAAARELVDRGNTLRAGFDVPGFVWIELGESMTLAMVDANGAVLSEHVIPWWKLDQGP